MKKQIRSSVVINKETEERLKYLKSQGINISFEFRKFIKKLYDKKILEEND